MPPVCSVSLGPIGKEGSQDSGVEVCTRESTEPDWELTEKKHTQRETHRHMHTETQRLT